MAEPIPVCFDGLDPRRPTVLFAHAGLSNSRSPTEFVSPVDSPYAQELVADFSKHWKVVEFDSAEVIVYPHSYVNNDETRRVALRARDAGKPCIFLERGENVPPADVPYGIVYAPSIFGQQSSPCERAMPSWHGDILQECGQTEVSVLVKAEKPALGFCGFVGTPLSRLAYRLTGRLQKVEGLVIRKRVLRSLERSTEIQCRFIRRSQYLGNASLAPFAASNRLQEERTEYIENLTSIPYGLAIRGKGNHSVRFCELLCAGRIPLFINTDCRLPFEDLIDYRKYVVWCEYSDHTQAANRLAAFHRSVSPEQFAELQRANRRLWDEWLKPLSFHRKIIEQAVAKVSNELGNV